MSEERKLEIAKQYVEKQLATMRRYGSAPQEISTQKYDAMVRQVAETIKS